MGNMFVDITGRYQPAEDSLHSRRDRATHSKADVRSISSHNRVLKHNREPCSLAMFKAKARASPKLIAS